MSTPQRLNHRVAYGLPMTLNHFLVVALVVLIVQLFFVMHALRVIVEGIRAVRVDLLRRPKNK